MNVLKKITFYPFLFAAHPVIYIYAENLYEVELKQIFKPLIYSLLLTVFVLFVARFIYKDLYKAAISTSVFITFFYSSGHFYNLVESQNFFKENFFFFSIALVYIVSLSMILQRRKLLRMIFVFVAVLFSIYLLSKSADFKLFIYDDLVMSCTIFWIVLMMFLITQISISKFHFKDATIYLNLSSLVLLSFPIFNIIKAFMSRH